MDELEREGGGTDPLLKESQSLSRLWKKNFFCVHPWHREVLRLGVESELQLPAYTTATAMQVLSHICKLHHGSRQCLILNPLGEARDWTRILMDTSLVLNPSSHNGNSRLWKLFFLRPLLRPWSFSPLGFLPWTIKQKMMWVIYSQFSHGWQSASVILEGTEKRS